MHYIVLVQLFEGFEELPEEDEGLRFCEDFAFLEQAFDGAVIAEFVDEVEVIGGLEGFDELDDVLVFEGGEDVDLIDGELFEFGVGAEGGFGDDFDGVLEFGFLVDGAVDLAVDPLPHRLLQKIVLDQFAHLFNLNSGN